MEMKISGVTRMRNPGSLWKSVVRSLRFKTGVLLKYNITTDLISCVHMTSFICNSRRLTRGNDMNINTILLKS